MPPRVHQITLIASTLVFSWLAFQAVHELGHVLHIVAAGGSIEYVVLHPLQLSYTHAASNPRPLSAVIGGPLWGCLLPLILWGVVRMAVPSRAYLARFFAATCLVANGVYLAADAFVQGGDGRELVHQGATVWAIVVPSVIVAIAGVALWNGQGRHFGLGKDAPPVRASDAWMMLAAAAAIIAVECLAAAAL